MLRSALLYLSSQPKVFSFVRQNRMAKGFAARFVAGETLDSALDAVKRLNAKVITASLDLLGESVRDEKEARGIVKLNAVSLAFTIGALIAALTAMGLVVAAPLAMSAIGLGQIGELMLQYGRWPVLAVMVLLGLALLYRFI